MFTILSIAADVGSEELVRAREPGLWQLRALPEEFDNLRVAGRTLGVVPQGFGGPFYQLGGNRAIWGALLRGTTQDRMNKYMLYQRLRVAPWS